MARLKVMLTDDGRTSTVRRQVDTSNMCDLACGAIAAFREVAEELNVPGFCEVNVSEGDNDDQESKQKESPRAQAGGAGSGEGGDEE